MVHLVGGVAIAVKANVTGLGAFAVDDATVIGLDVGHISACAEAKSVVVIGVVEGRGGLELWIVRDLNHDIDISLGLLVVVPNEHLEDAGFLLKVDLHPLLTRGEFYKAAVGTIWITIGNEWQIADDWGGVRGGDWLVFGEQDGASRGGE